MKIAFVSDSVYPWNIGGLETIENVEAEELAKSNEVHFFSLRWPGMEREFRQDKITYHTFHKITTKKFYRHGRRSIREAMIFTFGLLRIFKYRFDIVQTNEFPVLQLPLLKFYAAITGCKLIVDMHEIWDADYWTTYLGSFMGAIANVFAGVAIRGADHYIANSSITEQKLAALGVPMDRITVFSPIIDDRQMKAIRPGKPSREIVFAGRLIKEKRMDLWLAVVKAISMKSKVRGAIIGDGPESERIRSLIRRLKLEKIVELRPFYGEKDKRSLYKRIEDAGLLLHMSEREGLSVIALESISLGTPVLLPDYTPIPKDVKGMCVVANEKELPDIAIKILKGPKKDYIFNRDMIERFYVSRVASFYKDLFGKI